MKRVVEPGTFDVLVGSGPEGLMRATLEVK
jgi:hypothetical protein